MVGLFDRDVFLKLACCGLWDETLPALGITHPYRLASCTVSSSGTIFQRSLRDAAVIEAAKARLHTMVVAVPVIEAAWAAAAEASSDYAEVVNTTDVGGGEALLLAILQALGDPNVLVTGDKRFLTALKTHFPERHAAVIGRILSLERCLLAVCETHGIGYVVTRVLPVAGCDGSIRMALGGHQGADHAAFVDALVSCDPCRTPSLDLERGT
jgi:hypothetical protein